jgi:hypothetical protein
MFRNLFIFPFILSRVWVVMNGVWIGSRVYWTLTERNYNNYYSACKVFSVFTSSYLVAASNGGHLLNAPRPQLPASNSDQPALHWVSGWLTDKLFLVLAEQLFLVANHTWFMALFYCLTALRALNLLSSECVCAFPAYNISERTEKKAPFLYCSANVAFVSVG